MASSWRSWATIILINAGKSTSGSQPEHVAGLGRITDQQVDFGGAQELGVLADVVTPVVDPHLTEGPLDEFFDRVGLAGGDDVVAGFVLLQHQPHRLHIIPGVAPVALGVQVAEHHFVLQAEFDAGGGVGHLAGDELHPPPRALMVEQDAGGGVEPVGLAVVDHDVMPEHLGAPVRRTGVERGEFGLRGLADLAEHLRRRGLVEADRVVLRTADHADRLQHPQHTQTRQVRRQLRLTRSSTPRS